MTILEIFEAVARKLAIAVKTEEFKVFEPALEQLTVKKSIKMLGKCRFQHAISERWDEKSQADFEEILRTRCL